MATITAMLRYLESLENPYIAIHHERCILVRNRNADCLRCADACTSHCIHYEDGSLTITAQNCVGCGTCATVCPTCALETIRQRDDVLMAACLAVAERDGESQVVGDLSREVPDGEGGAKLDGECPSPNAAGENVPRNSETKQDCERGVGRSNQCEGGRVVIACGSLLDLAAGKYDPESLVRVECLGRVEETLLCELAAAGVAEVTLVHGACETCVHRCGWETLQGVLETQQVLLSAWGCAMRVMETTKLPGRTRLAAADYDAGKRESLLAGGHKVAAAGALATEVGLASALNGVVDDAMAEELGFKSPSVPKAPSPRVLFHVMEDGTLPHFVPDRRERLLDALATLGEPDDIMITTRLWGHVIIDTDRCQSCQMCATFCPSGALRKFTDEDGTFGVEHYPGDCVKCRCCEAICPEGAVEISDAVFAREMLAGMTDRYEMNPVAVERGGAHSIHNSLKTMMKTPHVFER